MSDESDHGTSGLPTEGCETPQSGPDSPERAGKDASQPNSPPQRGHHTIQSIGLDLSAARVGLMGRFLPPGRWDVQRLPLPSSPEELAEVAALVYRPEDKDQSFARYIRRARKKALTQRGELAGAIQLKAAKAAMEAAADIARASVEARKATDEVRAEVARQLAPISEAMKMVGEVLAVQMNGFLKNEPVNGELVTLDQARMAALGTASITAKLGGKVAEEATKEAEEAVFEEMRASTRERVKLGDPTVH